MTKTDVVKMANGNKELPVGVVRNGGNKKGYRLNRTVGGKAYSFGSFQNLEHALRTNKYIDIIVADLVAAQAKEGVLSVEQIREMIAENGTSNVAEVVSLFQILESNFNHQSRLLIREIARLHDRFGEGMKIIESDNDKSFLGLFKGRKNK